VAAQLRCGICRLHGVSFPIDHVGAAKYFKLAADPKNSSGEKCYGFCPSISKGVAIDHVMAEKIFKLAADTACVSMKVWVFGLMLCLSEGNGVPVDLIEVAKYFTVVFLRVSVFRLIRFPGQNTSIARRVKVMQSGNTGVVAVCLRASIS
jgi:hypothetical protein